MILIADIQRVVAEHYGLSPDVMREPDGLGSRDPTKAHPRQLAMYLARRLCSDMRHYQQNRGSYPSIGRRFGRDHTTVIHAIRAVEKPIQTDTKTQEAVSFLLSRITEA